MRLRLLAPLLLLGGCTTPLPPVDPQQAWIDLVLREPAIGASLLAESQDGRRLNDGRYFQLTPGAHSLKVSYNYELYGNGGFGPRFGWNNALQIQCYLELDYDDFQAGRRYRLKAEHTYGQGEITLYDGQRELVTSQRGICTPI
ncbi:lipoprotein [Pseudomonas oryzihabitans]|uniref:PA0061/PA0062 family lipoprotein n=1 Tax=Pseudomonas rhizoryzae TaxID=2571129 RepID=UPI00073781B1|nr:hypothetical protein [Pseudomonas rhizoryzae]APQ12521.1 hypothetical protein BJP27_13795 [Pseudomonas psychrotolerans]KTS79839.1 lipoprotein [Pseudomonas psychrotolerans]KTT04449.1 lipoprotein [Pseudomonas psychrotolerans]KTT12491.1 lipoprotein [Pseudomonas psychrotolerans]KTT27028.1 lipoprotein [Pseudomonas psychrotolerans]